MRVDEINVKKEKSVEGELLVELTNPLHIKKGYVPADNIEFVGIRITKPGGEVSFGVSHAERLYIVQNPNQPSDVKFELRQTAPEV